MIDFQKRFEQYLSSKTEQKSQEEIEELAPELYLAWLDTPADWLSGKSPNAYFSGLNPGTLIQTLGAYILKGIPTPGPLLGSIVDNEDKTYPLLISLMKNYQGEKEEELKTAIVRLIEEMEFEHPYEYYISVIKEANEAGAFSESCAEELKGAGEEYLNRVLDAYENTKNRYAADCFLDILADMPFDQRVFEHAIERFLYSDSGKAFYASVLGKLGCDQALPYLREALLQENIKYFDYIAVKNALEALGDEIDIQRDFTGDKDYDALIDMGD